MSRVEKVPNGVHQLSGSWQPLKMESLSDKELLVTFKLEGEFFSMRIVQQGNRNTIEETDKFNGKMLSVTRFTVDPKGRSITATVKDLQDGSTNQFVLQKQ